MLNVGGRTTAVHNVLKLFLMKQEGRPYWLYIKKQSSKYKGKNKEREGSKA